MKLGYVEISPLCVVMLEQSTAVLRSSVTLASHSQVYHENKETGQGSLKSSAVFDIYAWSYPLVHCACQNFITNVSLPATIRKLAPMVPSAGTKSLLVELLTTTRQPEGERERETERKKR